MDSLLDCVGCTILLGPYECTSTSIRRRLRLKSQNENGMAKEEEEAKPSMGVFSRALRWRVAQEVGRGKKAPRQ